MLCKSSQLTEVPSLGFCLLVLCPVVGFHSYSVFRPTRHSTLAPCSLTDDAASRASGRSISCSRAHRHSHRGRESEPQLLGLWLVLFPQAWWFLKSHIRCRNGAREGWFFFFFTPQTIFTNVPLSGHPNRFNQYDNKFSYCTHFVIDCLPCSEPSTVNSTQAWTNCSQINGLCRKKKKLVNHQIIYL